MNTSTVHASLIRDESLRDLSPFLKTYLFAADRAWCYERECLPALRAGALVLWDRYVASALAYRAVELSRPGTLIDLEFVKAINSPFQPADLTIIIDVSIETSRARGVEAGSAETYEEDFLQQVKQLYLELADGSNHICIDGEQPIERVARDVAGVIHKHFPELCRLD